MRTKEITLYQFKELSEESQQKAIEKLWDLNVTHDWWESVYEDAERIGLKITEFDLDRNRYVKGNLLVSGYECAELIIKNHGKDCNTYKTASQFLIDWSKLVAKYSDGITLDKVTEENENDFDNAANELESEFENSLLEDYSIILQNEYEFLTSRQAIVEAIEANEYEFTEDGELA